MINLILPALALSVTGCSVKENMDDCGVTRLLVRFDPSMFELPAGEHVIRTVHVYTFNENKECIGLWTGGPYDYSSGKDYEVPLDLPPGNYSFRVWTNLGNEYKQTPAERYSALDTPMDEFSLAVDMPETGIIPRDLPDLHYGKLDNAGFTRMEDRVHIIHLIPDTYRINLTLTGNIPEGALFESSITDNNSHFDFDNGIIDSPWIMNHLRTMEHSADDLHSSARILSLTDDHSLENIGRTPGLNRSPVLMLTNTSGTGKLFSQNLVEIIETAYSSSGQTVDFDKTYLFDIVLIYDENMNLTVKVNGWSYTVNGIEL